MRIAFVSANREVLPDPVVPLGILHVMAATASHHRKILIDLCFEPDPTDVLRQRLHNFNPQLVAVGLRNIQNSDYSGISDNLAYYQGIVAAIRSCTPSPVVLGGGGFTVMPRGLMRHLQADYGIAGEGEDVWPLLLAALEQDEPDPEALKAVANLHYWRDGELVSNPAATTFVDLARLPKLERSDVDRRYYGAVGIENLQTKRGCALACKYCTYPTIEGRSVRTKDPGRVVREMREALEAHPEIKHFFIVDAVFNIPPSHAKAVCKGIKAANLKIPWTCYANPIGFDLELATCMAEAGCAGMEIGSDSGCDEVLTRLGKGFATADVRRMHQVCAQVGLLDCHTFLLGTEGETMAHVEQSLEFIESLDPFSTIIMIWTDDDEALDKGLAEKRHALRKQILNLMKRKQQDNPHWIIPPLGRHYDARLFRLLRRMGLEGPLWQHIRRVGGRGTSFPRLTTSGTATTRQGASSG